MMVLEQYNDKNNTDYKLGDVEICEDGKVYEGNLSFDSGFTSWSEFQELEK
jgi:hypothetical protein